MTAPTLAIVLPSYRRLPALPRLVEAYLRQGADEVIVVLDGPHPGWRDVVPVPERGRVVELPANRGLARARIAGLEHVSADVVLAVDDDVVPDAGLVARHRSAHAGLADRVVQGYMPVALPARRGRDAAPTYLYARDYEAQARAWRSRGSAAILTSLWGGNLSLPSELYRRAEALKPSVRLEYNEDLDLGLRLRELGASAEFLESARARHHHRRGLAAYLRECEARGHAVHALEQRWGSRPPQLTPIVAIPPSYSRLLGAAQRRIAHDDANGAALRAAIQAYRTAGLARAWSAQDAIARFLRRALAMRGYRHAREAR